ncbi:molybdopterin-dependent oxidoreductase [Hydrotalea sandarakina]|uniref:Molybdopterin-dependent oxidoreductase-like protein n=1 Tax=Hydrotalea sandarakina TaxID=1004304 RepID=A0A2W7SJ55_9BACT|nr:molybdopterin-dependent oxidoreductase [Hydrotalea sandarakina]PZX62925.1 molybdopterin-dependent oxidoreductase-like protein [Hydrotalea sandarakina]
MKYLLLFLTVMISLQVSAQKAVTPTQQFTIQGKVKQPIIITLTDLEKYPTVNIPDVVITNYLGEARGKLTHLKGILLKDVLQKAELIEANPKLFSTFYYVLTAADGYSVVYSWNELLNSPVGEHTFIITAKNDESLKTMNDGILVLTPIDFVTGRRHVKWLKTIEVKQATIDQ